MRSGSDAAEGSEPGQHGYQTEGKDTAVALMMEEKYDDFADLRERAKAEVSKVVIGQDRTVELLLIAAVAHMLGASFKRIQFTPDTTPTELNGQNVVRAGEHLFMPGAVFTNVLLADEINRTPPRTQAALFEPMGERQVTVDGKAHKLPDPFLVIATQNPYEHRDVFELPESQLDRFLFKLVLDYADAQSEYEMLDLPHRGVAPDMLGEVRPLLGVVGLDQARDELDATEIPEDVGRYMVAIARASRNIPGVELGVSSRGIMHLASASKANARLSGRTEVAIEDVREIAPYVLRHRIIVDGSLTPDDVLRTVLEQVPVPEPVYTLR